MMGHKPSAAPPPSFVASGTHSNGGFMVGTTPLSIALPTFQTGDLGIIIAACENGSLNNVPDGWSLKLDAGGARLWTRTLQAGDGNPGVTASSNGARHGRSYVFRGVVTQAVEDSQIKGPVNGNDSQSPVNGCVMNTADPITANALIFQAFIRTAQTTSYTIDAPSGGDGFTEIHRVGGVQVHAAGYRIPASPGSYTPFNWTLSGVAPPYPFRYGMVLVMSS
jgi:hypothetical protein